MHLSYRNFSMVLFFIVCFGTYLFPQFDYPTIWDWQNPLPSGDDFTTSLNVPDGILIGGAGGSLIYANKKVKKELEKYLHEEVTDAALDRVNDVIFVLTHDKYTGKSHIFGLSPSSGGFKLIKSLGELSTFDKPISSVATDAKNVVLYSIGNIYSSIDGGKNYSNIPISEDELLNDAIFTATGRGIAVGEHDGNSDITKTNIYLKDQVMNPNDPESSDKWHPLSTNHSTNATRRTALFSRKWKTVSSIDKNISTPLNKTMQNDPIFILGYDPATNLDIVARSTDDGESWDSVFAVQTAFMKALSAGSSTNAIIGGYGGAIYYTKDGGDTWNKGNNDNQQYIRSITHVSADSAYAFGNRGTILLTIDGGENWEQISGDISTSFYGVYFTSPSIGYAAGLSGFSKLKVYKTSDAGENWNVIYVDSSFSPSNAFFNSIFFIDEMTGFIAGSKLIKTIDGGKSWNELNTGVSSSNPIFLDVHFVNNNLGFAVYRDPATGDGAIKTTDGGNKWSPLNINSNMHDKQYVYFADENLGFISGDSRLYRTIDGGDNWDTLSVGYNNQNLNSKVDFINSTTGFFGKKGQIFKTTDKGDTWTDAAIDNHSVPVQIQFVSDSIGYAICTSDTFGIPVHILFKTTDGGNSWSDLTDEFPGSTSFNAMFFTDESTGYLVGPYGKIIKTFSGGELITSVNEYKKTSLPTNYKLFQNYPNPFNPTTTIKYAIPSSSQSPLQGGVWGGLVTLKVYDILGREVVTLVNKQQLPGNYEVTFDASTLASGIYFYTLKTGGFIKTKKMLLIK